MSGICGRISPALSAKYNRPSVSLKTWQTTLLSDLATSAVSYRRWVIALHADCTRRLKSVRHTSASGSLFWPTPNANNVNDGEGIETWEDRRQREKAKHRNGNGFGTPLAIAAQMWPTPDVSSGNRDMSKIDPEAQKRANTKRTIGLPTVAATWATPRVNDAQGSAYQHDPKMHADKLTLTGQAALWAFPTARDYKATAGQALPTNGLLGRQVLTMLRDGNATSGNSQVLNPRFVEALMGWPIGMTNCASAVTASCQWWQHWRSWIFGDNYSTSEDA